MKQADLVVPFFLLSAVSLVAPHLTWDQARPMAIILLVAAFVAFIILEIVG